jgi:hypothetical protein
LPSEKRETSTLQLFLILASLFLVCTQTVSVAQANNGNAEVSRTGNLVGFQMTPGSVHPAGNASVCRTGNLVGFLMTPGSVLPSIQISSLAFTDIYGNQKTSFSQVDTIMLKAVIVDNGSQDISNALVSMLVKDPGNTSVFIGYTYQSFQTGSSTTIYLGFQLRDDAMLGNYSIKLNVLTALVSQQGLPLDGGNPDAIYVLVD